MLSLRALVPKRCHPLVEDFCFPFPFPEEDVGLNWLAEAVMGIPCWCSPVLVPKETQGTPLTGIAPRPCLAGEWEGGRAEWSFPLCSPQPFPGIMCFVLYGIALTDEKSNLKLFEILGLQKHLPNGNQWMPPLMEGLVFFMVLITSTLRIRKSLCSGITGDWDLGYLGKCCCQAF